MKVMTAIRQPGKINDDTYMIDLGMFDVEAISASFLIKGEKTCLIDTGTKKEIKNLVKMLKTLDAFPPDIVILTHPHFDHCQGINKLRALAEKENKKIEVYAGENAIPLLEDQSFHIGYYDEKTYDNITDVTPLKDGEIVDLGGITLKIYDTPGHIDGNIAILDEKNKNLILGDTIGDKVGDNSFIPPFYPPFFNEDKWKSSVEKLKQIEYTGISIAHFGYIHGEEAEGLFDESLETFEKWWKVFEQVDKEEKLDDLDYLLDMLVKNANYQVPDLKLTKFIARFMLGFINIGRGIIRKEPITVKDILAPTINGWLVKGYRSSKGMPSS